MRRRTLGANRAAYRTYVENQAAGGEADAVLAAARDRDGYVLGDERFREQVDGELYVARMSKVQTGDIVWPSGVVVLIERVWSAVAEAFDRPL
jgi:hypothetical protein